MWSSPDRRPRSADRGSVLLACVGLALVVTGPPTAATARSVIRDFTVDIARPGEAVELSLDSTQVELRSIWTRVLRGQTIDQLLIRNGINPDGESFAAILRLNPGLARLEVSEDTLVTLPVLVGSQVLARSLAHGGRAYLTIDVGLKLRLAADAVAMNRLVLAMPDWPAERFGEGTPRDTLSETVGRIRDFAVRVGIVLQAKSRPVDAELLTQLHDELGYVVAVLDSAAAGAPLRPTHTRTIAAIAEDVEARAGYWHEVLGAEDALRRRPVPHVCVTALRREPESGTTPASLRVYYISWMLYGQRPPHEFPLSASRGAGTSTPLSRFNYRIWAGAPGNPLPPLSDVVPLELSTYPHDTLTVKLEVRPK
jgi:hypothetical protein